MKKSIALWLVALLLTLALGVYQRLSGPTHPLQGREALGDIQIEYKFLRSWTSHRPLPVRASGNGLAAMRLHYRRYPFVAGEEWAVVPMVTRNGAFQGEIPGQPAAGKVAYKVEAITLAGVAWLNAGVPAVARFKNDVSLWLLIAHVLFMFAGMLLAFRTGLGALFADPGWQRFLPWTLAVTAAGGLLLGPLVQWQAFGALWTGFPLGSDLTDSKTLFAVLAWLAAFLLRRRSRWWTVLAMALMVAVYLIPHSQQGSELDYRTGKITTAK